MATIVMESARVIKAAENVLAHIDIVRKKNNQKQIDARMARKAWSIRRGFYLMTQSEAIDWLNQSDTWGLPSCYAWGDKNHAEKLLRLAKLGDPVTLNEEDTRVLFGGDK